MHDGCNGNFNSGVDVIRKLRMMGFNTQAVPSALQITCEGCGEVFSMQTYESACPGCGMIYGVTPCHAHDPAAVQCAGHVTSE
jgi:hypothetical protein